MLTLNNTEMDKHISIPNNRLHKLILRKGSQFENFHQRDYPNVL